MYVVLRQKDRKYLLQARMFFVTEWHPVLGFLSQPWWQDQLQPRSQALSSTLLAGENTLAGDGHVTHTKLIAY